MNIYESSENYLEQILMLKHKNGLVRAIDIATALNFSKASVSIALKKLKENDYITIVSNQIELTEKGLTIAKNIYERHTIIKEALMALGVNEETASNDACKMEHDLSVESFEAIKNHLINMKD